MLFLLSNQHNDDSRCRPAEHSFMIYPGPNISDPDMDIIIFSLFMCAKIVLYLYSEIGFTTVERTSVRIPYSSRRALPRDWRPVRRRARTVSRRDVSVSGGLLPCQQSGMQLVVFCCILQYLVPRAHYSRELNMKTSLLRGIPNYLPYNNFKTVKDTITLKLWNTKQLGKGYGVRIWIGFRVTSFKNTYLQGQAKYSEHKL